MQYRVLASDYDHTLAYEGQVSEATVAALERWRASGRRLVLVTGRHLHDVQNVFPQFTLFDAIVAENGALLSWTDSDHEQLLGTPPPAALLQMLRERDVEPLYVGKGSAATLKPHENTVRHAMRILALPWQIILNKNDVLMLPPGVEKASGLRAALDRLNISPAETVGIGDAENDMHLLDVCGYGVAVANALAVLKNRADHVTHGEYGAGVVELIDHLLATDTGG
jgi:hypothetical protein